MKKICNKYIVSIIVILVIIIALVFIINIVDKNKKIILNDNNTKYTNKYTEELDKKVEEIKQEYLE